MTVAAGITTIRLGHIDILGHAVKEIAGHKAGSLAGTVPQGKAILQLVVLAWARVRRRSEAGEQW